MVTWTAARAVTPVPWGPARADARLAHRELRDGPGDRRALGTRQRGPDERPPHRRLDIGRRVGSRQRIARPLHRSRVGFPSDGRLLERPRRRVGRRRGCSIGFRRARRRPGRRRGADRTVRRPRRRRLGQRPGQSPGLHARGAGRTSGGHGREERRPLVLLAAPRGLTAPVRMLRVAGRAARLADFVADHGDDRVAGQSALARAVVIDDITEPHPAWFHRRIPRRSGPRAGRKARRGWL